MAKVLHFLPSSTIFAFVLQTFYSPIESVFIIVHTAEMKLSITIRKATTQRGRFISTQHATQTDSSMHSGTILRRREQLTKACYQAYSGISAIVNHAARSLNGSRACNDDGPEILSLH